MIPYALLICYRWQKLESGWDIVDKTLENAVGIPNIVTKSYGPHKSWNIFLDYFLSSAKIIDTVFRRCYDHKQGNCISILEQFSSAKIRQ